MKATGIVRRIDDLGRVVIPKEIRRTLRIRVGDPLEIFTDREGEIILKKYSPIGELGAYAADYAESLAQTTGYIVCVADKDTMIAAAGTGKKECIGKAISQELEQMIQDRECLQATAGEKRFVPVLQDGPEGIASETICPIISEGDAVGSVIFLSGMKNRKWERQSLSWHPVQQDSLENRWNSKGDGSLKTLRLQGFSRDLKTF